VTEGVLVPQKTDTVLTRASEKEATEWNDFPESKTSLNTRSRTRSKSNKCSSVKCPDFVSLHVPVQGSSRASESVLMPMQCLNPYPRAGGGACSSSRITVDLEFQSKLPQRGDQRVTARETHQLSFNTRTHEEATKPTKEAIAVEMLESTPVRKGDLIRL